MNNPMIDLHSDQSSPSTPAPKKTVHRDTSVTTTTVLAGLVQDPNEWNRPYLDEVSDPLQRHAEQSRKSEAEQRRELKRRLDTQASLVVGDPNTPDVPLEKR